MSWRYWTLSLTLFLLILAGLAGCNGTGVEGEIEIDIPQPITRDLEAIKARDTLVVLTTYNSTSYFLYRGEPMGFDHDYLKAFAKAQDLHLKVHVVRNLDSLLVLLNEGVGDVVAARLTPTTEDSVYVGFTKPLYTTRPTVVQRDKPLEATDFPKAVDTLVDSAATAPDYADEENRETPARQDEVQFRARIVTKPSQLAGEEVHVLDDTRFEERLVEISDQLTGDIYVVEVDSGTAETLIRGVAQEQIDYTVSHENVARLQESYYENISVLPTVDQPYEVVWAVRKNAPALHAALNDWIDGNPGMKKNLYTKYFVDRQGYRERVADEYLTSETGRLSPYDDLFKEHAPALGWDWRLLASQAFQESRFKPRARSWAGAMGVLQLMPGTARQYGVSDAYDPPENVRGAVKFLEYLLDFWENIPDEQERLKFILASYNAGPGHVQDARRLTEKNGGDVDRWKDVAYWLLRKSERAVYTDPVVRHGFCRGLEPVTYVARILDRFDHYRQFYDPDAEAAPQVSAEPAA